VGAGKKKALEKRRKETFKNRRMGVRESHGNKGKKQHTEGEPSFNTWWSQDQKQKGMKTRALRRRDCLGGRKGQKTYLEWGKKRKKKK